MFVAFVSSIVVLLSVVLVSSTVVFESSEVELLLHPVNEPYHTMQINAALTPIRNYDCLLLIVNILVEPRLVIISTITAPLIFCTFTSLPGA